MRSLIIGGIVFIVWCIFSVWLYVDKLRPAMQNQVVEQLAPEPEQNMADTLLQADTVKKPEMVMPGELVVHFKFDDASFSPTPQSKEQADKFSEWITKNPGASLSVTGHTDNIGTDQYNQALGLRRAQTLQEYLVGQGIDAAKIQTISKGESKPVADNSTDEGRAENRRAVVSIQNK